MVGADDLQWVVYRQNPGGQPTALSFIHATKARLLRCLREAGCDLAALSAGENQALANLPNSFEWKHGSEAEAPAIVPDLNELEAAEDALEARRAALAWH